MRNLFPLVITILLGGTASAAVRLPAIFSDNMVLQRDRAIPVWGWAAKGETITVTLNAAVKTATADDRGAWRTDLPATPAGGPFELTVAAGNTIVLKNILVGDVWLCSGQSNMWLPVPLVKDGEAEAARADHPRLRLINVNAQPSREPKADFPGRWVVCSPQTVKGFSAVGYYFGRDLQKSVDVPIGLINSSWQGSPAEAWTSREALAADKTLEAILTKSAEMDASFPRRLAQWKAAMAAWEPKAREAKAASRPAPERPIEPKSPDNDGNRATNLFNSMVHPLIPFGLKGVIWYQGEANTGSRESAMEYRRLFPAMITDWRSRWGQGDFPFLYVQLAGIRTPRPEPSDPTWALLRESQAMTLSLPKTGMAVAIDIGDLRIHPPDKQTVGARLALAARAVAYEQRVEYSGPAFDKLSIERDRAVLSFTHVGKGLVAAGGRLKGFAIAGEDRKFVWADAVIDGDRVTVSSSKVPAPRAVRYGWAEQPQCNLYNAAGLPAIPFRTDNWDPAQP